MTLHSIQYLSCLYLQNIQTLNTTTTSLVVQEIIFHLDYYNSLLSSLPSSIFVPLQFILSAVGVTFSKSKTDLVTPWIKILQRLPIIRREKGEVLYKGLQALSNLGPCYSDLISSPLPDAQSAPATPASFCYLKNSKQVSFSGVFHLFLPLAGTFYSIK